MIILLDSSCMTLLAHDQVAEKMTTPPNCIGMPSLMSRTVGGLAGSSNSIFGADTVEMSINAPDYDSFMHKDDDYFGLMDDDSQTDCRL